TSANCQRLCRATFPSTLKRSTWRPSTIPGTSTATRKTAEMTLRRSRPPIRWPGLLSSTNTKRTRAPATGCPY
ncbi:hypothetical protein BGZ54_010504, partial [Gamsiella multidivaricata]